VNDAVVEEIVHGALLIGGIVFEVNNYKKDENLFT